MPFSCFPSNLSFVLTEHEAYDFHWTTDNVPSFRSPDGSREQNSHAAKQTTLLTAQFPKSNPQVPNCRPYFSLLGNNTQIELTY